MNKNFFFFFFCFIIIQGGHSKESIIATLEADSFSSLDSLAPEIILMVCEKFDKISDYRNFLSVTKRNACILKKTPSLKEDILIREVVDYPDFFEREKPGLIEQFESLEKAYKTLKEEKWFQNIHNVLYAETLEELFKGEGGQKDFSRKNKMCTSVKLDYKQVNYFPTAFSSSKNAKEFFLRPDLEIKFIPHTKELEKNFSHFIFVDIRNKSFEEFPSIFLTIKNLKRINFVNINDGSHKSSFTALPKEIGNWKYLTHLSFKNMNISSIPQEITRLNNLEYLNLEKNNLETLPDLRGLKKISTININYNKFKNLSFLSRSNVSFLSIVGNNFEYFPDELKKLNALQTLMLSRKFYESFSVSLEKLQKHLNDQRGIDLQIEVEGEHLVMGIITSRLRNL